MGKYDDEEKRNEAINKILDQYENYKTEEEKRAEEPSAEERLGTFKQRMKDVATEYYADYNSDENEILRTYCMRQLLDSQTIQEKLKKMNMLKESVMGADYYQLIHLLKIKNLETFIDSAVIETKAYLRELEETKENEETVWQKKYGIYKKAPSALKNFLRINETATRPNLNCAGNIKDLTALLVEARYGFNSTVFRMDNVFLYSRNSKYPDLANAYTTTNFQRKLRERFIGLPVEVEERIMNDPEKSVKLKRVYAAFYEYFNEKRNIDYTIKDLEEKFPELLEDSSKMVLVYRSGNVDPVTGNIFAKNRYESYGPEEHIARGSNPNMETAYISVTESSLVLPVYNMAKMDGSEIDDKKRDFPIIINVQKIYDLLKARQKELEGTLKFDGEVDLLDLLSKEYEESDPIQEQFYQRIVELDELQQYEKRPDLPESFFNRDEIKESNDKKNTTRSFAFASAELLFKSSIPQEAITQISPIFMEILTMLPNMPYSEDELEKKTERKIALIREKRGQGYQYIKTREERKKEEEEKNKVKEEIRGTRKEILNIRKKVLQGLQSSKEGEENAEGLSKKINRKIEENPEEYGLTELEADFLKRFYIKQEPISEYFYIPQFTEADLEEIRDMLPDDISSVRRKKDSELLKVFSIEEIKWISGGAKLEDINATRRLQMEMGIRTHVIKKLLSSEKFLSDIGVNLEQCQVSQEDFMSELRNLVQVSGAKPASKSQNTRTVYRRSKRFFG